jgi:hypothetical protein
MFSGEFAVIVYKKFRPKHIILYLGVGEPLWGGEYSFRATTSPNFGPHNISKNLSLINMAQNLKKIHSQSNDKECLP